MELKSFVRQLAIPALLALVVVGLGAAIWTVATWAPDPPLVENESESARVIEPKSSETYLEQTIDIHLTWRSEPGLRWPGRTGTITRLYVRPGSLLTNGAPVARVGLAKVFALTTASPLYRNISPRTRGADVADAGNAFLRLGLVDEEDVSTGVSTQFRRAIRKYNRVMGLDGDTLMADSIVWLPAKEFLVRKVAIAVGQETPPRGELAVNGAAELRKARMTPPEGTPRGTRLELPATGIVETLGLELASNSSGLSFDALRVLRPAVTQSDTVLRSAVLRLESPMRTVRLPSSAIVVGADGSTCVLNESLAPVEVQVEEGGPGYVEIVGDVPSRVVANSTVVNTADSCTQQS